jgi:antitoxin ParD1/3/4
MNVSLTPELEKLVQRKVKSGKYQTASEVVREGLRLLEERDEQREMLRRDIQIAVEELERGDFVELDAEAIPAFVEGVKRRGARSLARRKT